MPTFYPNQISTAMEIYESSTRYNILSAQMQSGKTGAALYYAFKMLKDHRCGMIFIISGNRDTALRKQWGDNIVTHLRNFAKETDEFLKMQECIKIYFGQDLHKVDSEEFKNSVCIWDESHYGQTKDQSLFRFFNRMEIYSSLKGRNDELDAMDINILSVSATPAAELASIHYDSTPQDKTIFQLEAGNGYRGIREFNEDGLIHKAVPILNDNKNKIIELLEKYKGLKKYMIIRAQNTKKVNADEILSNIAAEQGFGYVLYDGDHKDNLVELDTEPSKFTIVHVKGMLRMGKELTKDHICAIMETSQSINTDTCLQGLPGRCCGYHDKKIDIYVPKCFLQVGLIEYINFLEHGSGLSRCMLIKGRRTIVRNEDGRFPIVPILIRDKGLQVSSNPTEMRDHAPDVLRFLLEDTSLDGGNDPVQMAEVRKAITQILQDNTLLKDNLSTYSITSKKWSNRHYDVQNKHKLNVPRRHDSDETFGICYVNCDVDDLDMYREGDIWVFVNTNDKDKNFQFGPSFFEPDRKTIFLDNSDIEVQIGIAGQMATMTDEVTSTPSKFKSELQEMISNSLRLDGPNYGRIIGSNGENKRLLISKDDYKKTSLFDDKDNHYLDIIREMDIQFNISIKTKRVRGADSYWSIRDISW